MSKSNAACTASTCYASDRAYSDAESTAQARRIGIWRDARPVPPWAFRRTGRQPAL